ncbi:DegV family protein [Clostridium magnum]|uniref:Fatty acid-binding protein n=1 Tax=Clostridium magnum DSM 2767 TaxID=1121326 RepID=A0A161WTG5_9CLOT|nr:DegV family protein [Clostridium magnum]KZL90148.1 fatty acid-binding protein [Clostridium magnum DSM 2767]SHH62356.1 EDD domain protein, DegV family [Clostridium magnum DSM 2767]
MGKIKIITDSTSDLPLDVVEKYDIEVIPLLVSFGEETYKDGIDINLPTLLQKMNGTSQFPRTAQINPQRFLECYKRYLDEGYKIVSIHISSKMSGTYQSACVAKEMLETDDIVVIDSLSVTSGLGLLAIKAAKLKEAGLEINQIYEEIIKLIPHVKSSIVFNSLDNLVKGGRLSKTAGIIGNILGIKPILSVHNGEMVVTDKVRGNKKAIRTILDYMDSMGIKDGEESLIIQVENTDVRDALKEDLEEKGKVFIECQVGCVVGVHSGPNACGIFFIEKF